MTEFDQAAWLRAQRQIESNARKFAAQDKRNRASKSGGKPGGKPKFSRAARATRGQGSWTKAGKTPALLVKIHAGGVAGDGYSERQDGANFIDTNMLGRDARERHSEFQLDAACHPRVNPKNLFVHVSISRPAGEDLTPDQWRKVARAFMRKIGAGGCQYVCTRHTSKAHDHVHIIFSRAKPNGTLVSMSNNRWKWREAVREVEKELDITSAERPSDVHTSPSLSTSDAQVNAARRAQRRGTAPGHIDPAAIRQALAQACTPEQFSSSLKADGIQVKPAVANGKTTGILFQKLGAYEWLAGSSISREFSLPMIQKKIESNRQALLKRERELAMQREALDRQRQQAQALYPRERY